jgi:GNAT superfamily N-acetyltransferase
VESTPPEAMPDSDVKISTRRARLGDAGVIATLGGQLGYPATEKELAQRLAKLMHRPGEGVVLVAEACGEIVGWLHVSVTPLLEVPLRAEVNGLVVDETNRSMGVGAKLLEAAERWAVGKGCKSMSVRSNVIRERAHGFYLRHGYEHFKTQKAFRKSL